MWLMVVLQVGTVGAFGVTGGAFPDRDAVSDGDLVGSDEDVLDEQSEHPLALVHRGDLGVGVELSEKTLQIGGEGEVGLAVGELGVESINLVVQVGFSRAQVGHPGAQFVDSNQLLAVGLDHAGDRGGRLGQRGVEAFALPRNGISGTGGVESPVDLGADALWVGQQPGDVIPHHLVEVVGADRFVGAHPAALVAVVVRAQTPVVVDRLVGGARRGAVVAVAAACAGGQPLQQRRTLLLRAAKRLLSSSRRATRSKVSVLTMAGTGMVVPCSRGRSTVLDAHGVARPCKRATRFRPADSATTMVLPNTAVPA